MAGVNKVILVGNVGQDPEMHYFDSGDAVAKFSLATSEKWKTKAGEQKELTEWHKIEVYGATAKVISDYVTKGKPLYIEGSLRTEEWTDKEGNKRKTTKVRVAGPNSRVVLLGSKGDSQPKTESLAPTFEGATEPFQATDDDVPF
jgi:single-strand DNA-binding protein